MFELQDLLWGRNHAVLIVLQGWIPPAKMVRSGRDSRKAVVVVLAFPTKEEQEPRLPVARSQAHTATGRMDLFNRSHYEDILVVRVEKSLSGIDLARALWSHPRL